MVGEGESAAVEVVLELEKDASRFAAHSAYLLHLHRKVNNITLILTTYRTKNAQPLFLLLTA